MSGGVFAEASSTYPSYVGSCLSDISDGRTGRLVVGVWVGRRNTG